MKKKTAKKILFLLLLMVPLLGLAHFFVFPQETRCILVALSDFKRTGNLYYKNNIPKEKLGLLKKLMSFAEEKDQLFWSGNSIIDYKLIYCADEKLFSKYAPGGMPAATYMKLGAYIVIRDEGIDSNIIAHELSHTILYRNIGWYKRTFSIPAWFDEGLAMQTDDRSYYSIDSLQEKQKIGLKLPDITKLKKAADFFTGDNETVMLNYSVSKYIVHEWLKTHSLEKFIQEIKSGSSFEKAYNKQ